MLPNMIAPKPLYEKFIQKYRWIEYTWIYHHAKFDLEPKKIVQREIEKEKSALQ
jgi:hypothetical protein